MADTDQLISQAKSQTDDGKQMQILDLGGGTGRYAIELSKRGHTVTLVDISQSESDRAAKYAEELGVSVSSIVKADAHEVRNHQGSIFRESHYDMILYQGPFYHLLEEREHIQLLTDCARMARPGGFVLAAFVTKFAHLREIAQRDPGRLYAEEFYVDYLKSGNYSRNSNIQSHHVEPGDIQKLFDHCAGEHGQAGPLSLKLERIVAGEGFLGGGLSSKICAMEDEAAFEAWVDDILLGYAGGTHVLGTADHLLAVARRD